MRVPSFVAALVAAAACGAPEAPRTAPNVLLVCLDTFRSDHMGLFGYERETAPFLAGLARTGTSFTGACSSSSWTSPATASLLSGCYPTRHGVVRGFFAQRRDAAHDESPGLQFARIPSDIALLPELLSEHGYTTLGLSTNMNVGPELGFDRGFARLLTRDGWPAERVLARLEEQRDDLEAAVPWFLYLHLNDTHEPYERRDSWYVAPGSRAKIDLDRARYDSEIGYLDAQLREIFSVLDVRDDTLVVVVADHGEEFLEHGRRGHGFSLHGELNRSLFFVRAPALGVVSRRVELPVSLVDVLPTVLELAGLPAVPGDGRSLATLARGGDPGDLERRTVFAHRTHPYRKNRELWSAVQGNWKLIEGPAGDHLFDLHEDPGEHTDRAADEPQRLAELKAALERFRARGIRELTPTGSRELDDELLERLEELGYTE